MRSEFKHLTVKKLENLPEVQAIYAKVNEIEQVYLDHESADTAARTDDDDVRLLMKLATQKDREQGGKDTLSKEKAKLHSLITLKETLEYMKKAELVDEDNYNITMNYLNKPEQWNK